MGREARCRVRHEGTVSEGRALLETDELLVRGELRLSIDRKRIRSVSVSDGWLEVEHDGGVVGFELGRQAQRWADSILNLRSRLDKLDVKPGQRVLVEGSVAAEFVRELRERAPDDGSPADLIFLAVESPADLERLADLEGSLERGGAIWVIRPKGRKDVTEGGVMAAGRAAGLVDVKVARFSDTHTAEKFVIPLDRR
ncbi:MAG: DUF3052 domain-containing protein [Gaiellales bacterium]